MAYITETFESSNRPDWQWPVHVAIPVYAGLKEKAFLKFEPTRKFASIITTPEFSSRPDTNILLVNEQALRWPRRNWTRLSGDIIILITSDNGNHEVSLDDYEKEFSKIHRSSGVFKIKSNEPEKWFSAFISELSKNKSAPEAIEATVASGAFYYDRRLEQRTTLSAVLKNVISNLRRYPFADRTFLIKLRISSESVFRGLELADLLTDTISQFDFDAGEGWAEELAKISTAISEPEELSNEGQLNSDPPPRKDKSFRAGHNIDATSDEHGRPRGFQSLPIEKRDLTELSDRAMPENAAAAAAPEPEPELATKRSVSKDSGSTSRKPKADKPRYLQAALLSANGEALETKLQPANVYKLETFIGYKTKGFTSTNETFDTGEIFDNNKKTKATIHLELISNVAEKAVFKKIVLPREGNSSKASFELKIPASIKKFIGTLSAYHENRMIQQVTITAPVSSKNSTAKGNNLKLTQVLSTRKNLSNLEDRTKFETAIGIDIDSQDGKPSRIHGMNSNSPVDMYLSDGLKNALEDIKDFIEDALIDYESHPANINHKNNQLLLLKLALKGSEIYVNHLRGHITTDGPLQIISNRKAYAPLDFVYSKNPPDPEATLCAHAVDSLAKGTCGNCFDQTADPSPHICPFGFWALSRVIERHSYETSLNGRGADYSVVSEPTRGRQVLTILQHSLLGTAKRIETNTTRGLRKSISDDLEANCLKMNEANKWIQWGEFVKSAKPDSLVLVVHIEEDANLRVDKMEIGDGDFVFKTNIGSKVILKQFLKPPPFVIVIGCESQNIKNSGFDVASQMLNEGAAIVLSTFTKIRGRQAKEIVVALIAELKKIKGTEQSFGEVMLKLRQILLSEGIMASLSMVSQGDADWKIKT